MRAMIFASCSYHNWCVLKAHDVRRLLKSVRRDSKGTLQSCQQRNMWHPYVLLQVGEEGTKALYRATKKEETRKYK